MHDLDGLSAEDFQRIFGVNTIGPFQMIRAARSAAGSRRQGVGPASAVVNVSSVAGISGGGSSVAYAASKGALNTMTHSLARALAPLIRVNTVCPGYIDTPWFTKGRGEAGAKAVRDAVVAKVPLKVASIGRRYRAAGVLPRVAGVEQHDRRIRADGCGDASDSVRTHRILSWPGKAKRASRIAQSGREWWARRKRAIADLTSSHLLPGSEITRLATSRFQMNSTISAPMVAVMKPAPWSGL